MKCRECGAKMRLDDKDVISRGNYDNYWCCDNCQTGCIEHIRFGQPFQEFWHSENNGKVKDYTIKHRIERRVT